MEICLCLAFNRLLGFEFVVFFTFGFALIFISLDILLKDPELFRPQMRCLGQSQSLLPHCCKICEMTYLNSTLPISWMQTGSITWSV